MYGFNPPIHEALGYGKGLHDALAEMHKRALAGDVPTKAETEALVDRHLHTPYAYPALREQLRRSAIKAIDRYFDRHGGDLTRTIHSEKLVEVQISPGVTVNGRIDLIKSMETGETAIVDFKSTQDSQAENVTKDQLSIYALGYQQLTGTPPTASRSSISTTRAGAPTIPSTQHLSPRSRRRSTRSRPKSAPTSSCAHTIIG